MKFEEICENPNGEIYKKLQKFQSLRNEIESETQKYTLYELRVKIAEIDNTFLAERIKDDEVI